MAIGSDGTIYLVGNEDRPNQTTRATIVRGSGSIASRTWSMLAQTEDYPRSNTAFDHRFNGAIVSPDNQSLYVASGSRTDHGEVQSAGGLYLGTREVGLTAVILKLPTNAQGLLLVNDRAALKSAGHVFAEGVRNTFDMAFGPNGELFGTENGPDRDMSEELNWLRPGQHYGFPWRIGGSDNPQQYSNYNPAEDLLLDSRFVAVFSGFYYNDPTFPSSPVRCLVNRYAISDRTPINSAVRSMARSKTPATCACRLAPLLRIVRHSDYPLTDKTC
jgi:glucose/arabinose dehydrogenase